MRSVSCFSRASDCERSAATREDAISSARADASTAARLARSSAADRRAFSASS